MAPLAILGVKWPFQKGLTQMDLFFVLSTLKACIFGTTGSSETYCTQFKGLFILQQNFDRTKVWQHFYLLPHPCEKGHFTPKMAKGITFIFFNCTCPRIAKNINFSYTVTQNECYTFGCLWSKMAFFKRAWQKVKVLSRT